MTKKVEVVNIEWADVHQKSVEIANEYKNKKIDVVVGVARGGIIPAYFVAERIGCQIKVVDSFSVGCLKDFAGKIVVLVDEIYDTGATSKFFDEEAAKWKVRLHQHFIIDKRKVISSSRKKWFVFPWETSTDESGGRKQAVVAILRSIGEDPRREGLTETPERVARMWDELSCGYKQDANKILAATFSPNNYDEMILLNDIRFFSLCEHHLLPFWGRVHFAYIPGDRIVGLSKIARLVEMFSRRVQIQERMTMQIGQVFEESIKPKGVGVIVEAIHFCMMMRGVEKENATMKTSYLGGIFRESDSTRAEFFKLVGR